MIDPEHALSIVRQAKELEISRSTVYYQPRPVPDADLFLMWRIDELHLNYPFAGSRMLRDMLGQQGLEVGRRHVRTLMRRMGVEAIYRKPNTSKPAPGHRIYPYLLRGLAITRPNQVWAMDITYIPMARGFVYLAALVDWFSRRVLAWRLSITIDTSFCIEALEEAIEDYGRPEIFNTIKVRSSPVLLSLGDSRRKASRSAWTARAAGPTMSSSSGCGARSNTNRSTCTPTSQWPKHESRSAAISRTSTANARIRAWGHKRPTRYTSTVRRRHWRHNAQPSRPWKCRSDGKRGKR